MATLRDLILGYLLAALRSALAGLLALGVLAAFATLAAVIVSSGIAVLLDPAVLADTWWAAGVLLLTVVVSVYMGAATTRILARAFPLRSDGKRRLGVVIGLGLFGVTVESALVYAYALMQADADGVVQAFSVLPLIFALAFITVGLYPLVWTMIRHVYPPTQHGLLYLRRFAGPGNTAILRLLLHATPPGLPVAFIAGPAANTRSWDPLLLAFAGIRWSRPWSNIPLYLRSEDDTWISDVREWVARSRVIAIDCSDDSQAVRMEAALIENEGAADRTIALLRKDDAANRAWPRESRVVSYQLSWVAAAPRIGIGIVGLTWAATTVADLVDLGSLLMFALLVMIVPQRSLTRESRQVIKAALLAVASENDGAAPIAGGSQHDACRQVRSSRTRRLGQGHS